MLVSEHTWYTCGCLFKCGHGAIDGICTSGYRRIRANDILVLTTGESSGCEEGGNDKSRSSQQSKANHDRQRRFAYGTEKKR